MTTLNDFTATTLRGTEQNLSDYRGKVVLVVNTASRCGLTPQYRGLQKLYEEYADRGLKILGFPCDQFAHQEPGDAEKIEQVCRLDYGVTFPMFDKIEVNGPGAHPLYVWLKKEKGGLLGGAIKWNFTKFLVGRDGTVLERFAPQRTPEALRDSIVEALAQPE